MSTRLVLLVVVFFGLLAALAIPLGHFMTRVFAGESTFLGRVMGPVERFMYRLAGVDAKREHGKTASLKHLDPKYRRKFGYRKSKAEINKMVATMLGRGITGLGPRMGAWCAGYISDAEL